METQTCTKCLRDLPVDRFAWRSRLLEVRQRRCKDCVRSLQRATYAANPEGERDRVALTRKAVTTGIRERSHELILAYLNAHPCVDCGQTDWRVLQFDHQGDKDRNVADMIRWTSLARLQREIDKCVIRCGRCHRIKTALDQNNFRVKWLRANDLLTECLVSHRH